MILTVGAWYNDVGYTFEISHKVSNYIREEIKKKIFSKYGLNVKDKEMYLNLEVATSSKTKELEVRGPEIKKRAKMINYGLWLPFDDIHQSIYPLETYIDYFFEALKIVFNNYNVPKEEFEEIKEDCKKEILNNQEYVYVEDF
jgi:hypothetical protein